MHYVILFLGILIGFVGGAFFFIHNIDKTTKAVEKVREEANERWSDLVLDLNETIQKLEKMIKDKVK